MYPLSNLFGETLTFNQPSLTKREFELVSSKGVLTKLTFPKLLSFDTIVEGFDSKWEIKRSSLWSTEVGIYKYGNEMPFAKYVSNFWKTKGTIQLPKGVRLKCKTGQFKKPFDVYSSSGKLLLTYSNKFILKGKTTATITERSEVIDKYPWIIMLGWYIILQNRRGRVR